MAFSIPVLDLKKQIAPIKDEIIAAMMRVIDNGAFILGQEVKDLESEVERYCGVKHAIGVSNGTDALRLGLLSMGIQPGDGVVCPAFTFYATAGAVASIGAVPLFADIDPRTYCLSAASLEQAVRKGGKAKATAVIPVNLYGQCADFEAIAKLASRYGLRVLEDNAQAFGASYKGKKAGSFGDCAGVSFFPGKNLGAFGDAGMVLTGSDEIDTQVRLLRNQGNQEKYYHLVLGHNHRMDALQAAVIRVKLKYIDDWNKKRQENARFFDSALSGLPAVLPYADPRNSHVYHHYIIRVSPSSKGLMDHLKGKRIDSRVYYPVPLHLQKCFAYLGYRQGDFPESEKAAEESLCIPVYPDLTTEEREYIAQSIKEFFNGHGR